VVDLLIDFKVIARSPRYSFNGAIFVFASDPWNLTFRYPRAGAPRAWNGFCRPGCHLGDL